VPKYRWTQLDLIRRPSNEGASKSLILPETEGGAISFLSSSRLFECKILFAYEFFWIFCNLLNLLESFGIFWILLESFGIFWKFLEFLSSLVGLGLRSSSELLSSSWSILGTLGLESISSLVLFLFNIWKDQRHFIWKT